MNFISLSFLGFFAAVFAVYWAAARLPRHAARAQNLTLLAASYLFYALAAWRAVPLLLLETAAFYALGRGVARFAERREAVAAGLTRLGVVLGVGVLVYFKYLNFLVDGVARLLNQLGWTVGTTTLQILMPLGISFFTFRLIAYVIEVHRGRLAPYTDFVAFAAYVAFFPTILSGPIDRPDRFLPQLERPRAFDCEGALRACRLILWGLFTKICVADRLALYTDAVFQNLEQHNGRSVLMAALMYPLQMYGDFCGYSNLAIGLGALLGLSVARNFNHPFFATNIAEYWRRWHMSLTSWLTDYVFIPLNIRFRVLGKFGIALAVVINLVLVGMWHGDSLTFAVFGLYHGLLMTPIVLLDAGRKKRKKKGQAGAPHPVWRFVRDAPWMLVTYLLVAAGLVVFRLPTLDAAWTAFTKIFTRQAPVFQDRMVFAYGAFALLIMLVKDFVDECGLDRLRLLNGAHGAVRFATSVFLVFAILLTGVLGGGQFIYFQF